MCLPFKQQKEKKRTVTVDKSKRKDNFIFQSSILQCKYGNLNTFEYNFKINVPLKRIKLAKSKVYLTHIRIIKETVLIIGPVVQYLR